MNTQLMRQHLDQLDKILTEIEYKDIAIKSAAESIKGIGGDFPKNRAEWIKVKERDEKAREQLCVDFRCYLNGLR